MNEEDLRACQQCAQLRESLEPCDAGCGREICSYCGPKCKECTDQEVYDQIREEKEEEKRQKEEAKKPKWEPERSLPEKVWRAMDWVFGQADDTLRRELQYYEGEFENYEFEDIQEMMKERWKGLPEWKKNIYKTKKKAAHLAYKTMYKVGTTGGRIIGHFDHSVRDINRLGRKFFKPDYDNYDDDEKDDDEKDDPGRYF